MSPMMASNRSGGRSSLLRWLPLLALALGCASFFVLGLHRYVSFEMLGRHRDELAAWVVAHPFLAPLAYILVYIVVVAFSLPGGAVLTITGGFLFGTVFGTLYAVLGATVGAMVVFVAARTALGDVLRAKAGGAIKQMEEGFRRNALNYLLVLRLVPIFPFFLVNLVPAFLGVPAGMFFFATFIGIIPGTLVYASVGNGLGAVLEAGGVPDLGIIFRPAVLLPILGLAALALVPVLYRQWRGK